MLLLSGTAASTNQVIDMPVSFFIDPDMANDPNLDGVTTITLSYTFFKSQVQSGTAATSEKSGLYIVILV